MSALRVLFVCGRGRCRSPTAEVVLRRWPGVETDSAGVRPDSDVVVTPEHVAWAEVIVLMERRYRQPLVQRVGMKTLKDKRIVAVDVPDDFDFMDDALVSLVLERVPRILGLPDLDE